MTSHQLPEFDAPDLGAVVEQLPPDAVDALPFGVIRLAADGTVQVYSEAERRLSGSGARPRVGLGFFTDVAPCMDTPEFRGRIEQALAAGQFDIEFGWTGDFADRSRDLRVRALPSSTGGLWLFLQHEA